MKVTILGAGGVRSPLMLRSFILRQDCLALAELALMDIDAERLELMGWLTAPLERANPPRFRITRTTDARAALAGADYVITTFRVGDMAARAVDERVALDHGVLGQETTGPGGYAMGLRTIPVLFQYLDLMREVCPEAWLLNFANPAGMLAEAVIHHGRWPRAVGICDTPASMLRGAANLLQARPEDVYLEYFGLNHLGWASGVWHRGRNRLPELIERFAQLGGPVPSYPFAPGLIQALGMLPNEYLYYYYSDEAVKNLCAAGRTRGEQLLALNSVLFAALRQARAAEDFDGLQAAYERYYRERGSTYFAAETGGRGTHDLSRLSREELEALGEQGYAGVALNVMEALAGPAAAPKTLILNVANRGAISGMRADDVVETVCWVGGGQIRPLAVGCVPDHALGLMKQVKAYERLTVEAALTGRYATALAALALHPLVPSHAVAKAILDEYVQRHGALMPKLS
ncbi:MAG: 6-phospho-beta-glucosidase [Anaerolineales bacterium]|nr:6-phospho-beta-glucosidase [Anaerolineales bacterium]